MNNVSKRGLDGGLVGSLYEIKTLPNTALQLVNAIYKQKDLSRAEAREMAEYLDERYGMSDYVPTFEPPKVTTIDIDEMLENLGESHFEYHPVGTTGEWRRFKEDLKAQLEQLLIEAREQDEYGNPMIQLNMYEAKAVANCLETLRANKLQGSYYDTGDWFLDVPRKVKAWLITLNNKAKEE